MDLKTKLEKRLSKIGCEWELRGLEFKIAALDLDSCVCQFVLQLYLYLVNRFRSFMKRFLISLFKCCENTCRLKNVVVFKH